MKHRQPSIHASGSTSLGPGIPPLAIVYVLDWTLVVRCAQVALLRSASVRGSSRRASAQMASPRRGSRAVPRAPLDA